MYIQAIADVLHEILHLNYHGSKSLMYCRRVQIGYMIHLYCLAVQAGFYSDVVECSPQDRKVPGSILAGIWKIFKSP